MKKMLLAIAALLIAAPAVHAQVPDGPYRDACRNIRVVSHNLVATCKNRNTGYWTNTVLFLPCNGRVESNQVGNLTCNGVPGPAWSPTANYVAFTINGSGAIATNVGGACDRSCTLLLNATALAAITATPKDPSIVFDSWDGDCKGTAGSVCYLDTTLPHRVTANFRVAQNTPVQHTLTITPALHGTIVDASTGGRVVHCSHADMNGCSASINGGALIMLAAWPDSGYAISGWGGDCGYSRVATCVLPMSADRRVSATFNSAGVTPVAAPVSPPVSPPSAAQ